MVLLFLESCAPPPISNAIILVEPVIFNVVELKLVKLNDDKRPDELYVASNVLVYSSTKLDVFMLFMVIVSSSLKDGNSGMESYKESCRDRDSS